MLDKWKYIISLCLFLDSNVVFLFESLTDTSWKQHSAELPVSFYLAVDGVTIGILVASSLYVIVAFKKCYLCH